MDIFLLLGNNTYIKIKSPHWLYFYYTTVELKSCFKIKYLGMFEMSNCSFLLVLGW